MTSTSDLGAALQSGALRLAQRIAQRDAELQAQRAGVSLVVRAGAVAQAAPSVPATTTVTPSYSRFIPREELGHFAAWQPDSFGDSGRSRPNLSPVPDPALQRRVEARAAAEADAAAARAVEDERAARAAELRQASENGYRDGRAEGQAEIERFKHDFAVQTGVCVDGMLAALQHRLADLEADLARRVAFIALDLARQVVRSELVQNPVTVLAVAQEALGALLVSARHVTLTLNPDDLTLVTEGAGELIAARGARLVGDCGMERGGCLVDSDIGLVDATVATRWQRASAAMGQSLAWDGRAAPAPASGRADAAAADPADPAGVDGAAP
jgi:flagellar assembly protein FliH